jgi:hypothetical protein
VTNPVAFAVGAGAGVFGALLPGPLAAYLMGHEGSARPAPSAAARELVIAIAAGLVLGPRVAELLGPPSGLVAGFACVTYGGILAVAEFARRAWTPAAIPLLAVQWTLLVGFAASLGYTPRTLEGGLSFAGGIWLGVGAWLACLWILGGRIRPRTHERWLRTFTIAVGLGFVGLGLYAAARVAIPA